MTPILQIAWRELNKIVQDSRLRSVVLIAPFIYAGVFCLVYSRHTLSDLPIAIVQQDPSSTARTLIRMLGASPKLSIVKQVDSTEELRDLIYDRKIDAAVVIPKDFAARLKTGQDSRVTAYVNAANMVSANIAAKAINEVVQTFSAGVQIKTLMKKGARLSTAMEQFMPVKLDLRTLFNPSFNYSNFMIPGLLMAILQQVILLGVALSWTGEKENGTLSELFSISNSPWKLMAGKSLPYLVINGLVAEFYLRVLFPLNDIPMEGSWWIAIPFTFLFILTVVSWGMWVSGLCKTRLFATQALMFVAMPSFILSGFTWPAEGMPEAIRFLGDLLPMTYFVNSLRSIYLGDAPLRFVISDFLKLGGFLIFNLGLTYLVVRRLILASSKLASNVDLGGSNGTAC